MKLILFSLQAENTGYITSFLQNALSSNPTVSLTRLSKQEINELCDSLKRHTINNGTRKFSLHNLGREPVTDDFHARFSLAELDVKFDFCGALSFPNETDFSCCQNGKVKYDAQRRLRRSQKYLKKYSKI